MPCSAPPDTVSPSSVERRPSIPSGPGSRAARRRPGWCVAASRGTVTVPPVTAPIARNGAALERSGSIVTSTAPTGPGRTRQRSGSGPRPRRRARAEPRRSCRCGGGTAPACRRGARRRPRRSAAPASSRAETNCDDAEASMVTSPPRTAPVPCTVNGQARRRRPRRPGRAAPSSTEPIGRVRACGSPSKATGPSARAATGGHEPHHGAGQPAVDRRPARRAAPG